MRAYWIICCLIMFSIGSCCGSQCVGDDLADAKKRLQAIQEQKQQAEEIAKAAKESTSADSAEELATDTPLPPSADVFVPVPDPISTPPVVTFSTVVSATERKERLPRGLLLVGKHCSPCDRMLAANLDLTGGKDAPIEVVQVEYANELDELGVSPSMLIHGTPLLIVLGKDRKIHSLTPNGFGCYLSGFHNRGEVIKYLSLPEHGVDLTPAQDASAVVATVEGGSASPELFAAVLAAHLMESSGQETDDSPVVMGSLFDFTINVEDSWKRIASTILTTERVEFASAGLSIEWGAEQTLTKTKNAITIQPPVKVTARKWVFHYSAGLNGLRYADDLSSVTLDLSGAPDVTINLVSRKVASEKVWIWSGSGERPHDMPPRKGDREFDGGPDFGNGSWAQREEDGTWLRYGG